MNSPHHETSITFRHKVQNMSTRRQFVQSLPAFAVTAQMLGEPGKAVADPALPAADHFHPKGKPPSEFTREVLRKARASLPFGDTRDFEEQKRGLIAPMKDLKIPNDSGGVAWDMTQFQFLDQRTNSTPCILRCTGSAS